jgi:hypothetical protein
MNLHVGRASKLATATSSVGEATGNGSQEAGDLEVAPTTAEFERIAGLVGPALIALSASEALNYRIWDDNLAAVTYLNGTLLFVAGLAIVRVHNRWMRGWPVLTTLVGWSAMALGLVRMFAPEARQPRRNAAIDGVLAALFTGGVVLTFKAYRPGAQQR